MRKSLSLTILPLLASSALVAAPDTKTMQNTNPFFSEWKTPFGLPPFEQIKTEHFMPAYKEGMARQKAEIQKIVNNPAAPTFKNTVEALDDSGLFLGRVDDVFGNLAGAETNERIQAIAKEVAPLLSAHYDDISLNGKLFERIKTVFDQRATLKLDAPQSTLLEKTYLGFVRNGANLNASQQERLRSINKDLSLLTLKFSENLLKENNAFKLVIEQEKDLEGLPEALRMAGAEAAKNAGLSGKWVYTLHAPSIWPFLTYAKNRELRKQILTAYATRCNHGDAFDNKEILTKIARFRVEKAQLLGYKTWADYGLEDAMAKTPDQVMKLLNELWEPAKQRAKAEAGELQAMIDAEKGGFKLEPWDWRYYAQKVKMAKYDLDESALKPYFPLDKVREGAFEVAGKLFGITFTELKKVPVYHKEVRAFEVKEKDGRHVGILYVDFHPRPGKRGGAWMSNYRPQWIRNGKRVAPIIVNVCNFSRPTGDAPALLGADEVRTLFHEFGHALHGLLSQCRYRGQSGTSVARDFVELPSQIMENWAMEPEVLRSYAKHYRTGETLPEALIQKMQNAKLFDQGFTTVEYLAAALLDMNWHTLNQAVEKEVSSFEQATMAKIGMMPEIIVRYRSTYFNHIVGGYSAGYYSYIWSAVLDADAFQAFKEKGNLFDPAAAKAFRTNVLEKGGSEDPMVLYKRFRGAEPSVEPLLKRRGLK